jgi:DNA-directed RNA polymerase subunit L
MVLKISNKQETDGVLTFTVSNVNVSVVNALRRTMVSDITSVVFHTFPNSENKCTISKNTTRFNNEIIKHRLSCIPIHITDLTIPLENFELVVHKRNDGGMVEYITSEDFHIKDIKTGKFLSKGDRDAIFPKNSITNHYIEFIRLRPKLASNVEGEELSLTAKFSINTAKENAAYNQTSTCFYKNTVDAIRANDVWMKKEKELKGGGMKAEDIAFEKKNWFLLDAYRISAPDSFDFIIKSVGIFENKVLIQKACDVLMSSFTYITQSIETDNTSVVMIKPSSTTMENCVDIILHNYDYTVGKVLEYFLYTTHYQGDKMLTFCGFIKEHPHDTHSILRIAFKNQTDNGVVKQFMVDALTQSMNSITEFKANFVK